MSKPVAVIRTLEDSPDWLDQRLVEAYLRTSYKVIFAEFPFIRINTENPSLEDWLNERNFKTYAFITAWNPGSTLLSETENRLNNKDLEIYLKKVSRLTLPALNVPDTGNWLPEESFWALDISFHYAICLGRKYGQNAIVWWEKDGLPELWWL